MMAEEISGLGGSSDEYAKHLEGKKAEFIEKIRKLNGRLRYKEYEKKALEPFLEQTKDVQIGLLRKELRQLEFRISTQAYTPKIEKELIKEVKKLESELSNVSEIERARRKKKLVDMDIDEAKKQISEIEPELKKIREALDDYYEGLRASRKQTKKGITSDHTVTLEEIAVFEKGN